MTIRQAKEINPTMKVVATGENTIEFREMQAVILRTEEVKTMYGMNVKAVLENATEDLTFDLFINNFSMQNLISAYGADDDNWKEKIVDLKKELDSKYNKQMIVLYPVPEIKPATDLEPTTESEPITE